MDSARLFLKDGLKYTYTKNCYNLKHPSSRVECSQHTYVICATGLLHFFIQTVVCIYIQSNADKKTQEVLNPEYMNESNKPRRNTFPSFLK